MFYKKFYNSILVHIKFTYCVLPNTFGNCNSHIGNENSDLEGYYYFFDKKKKVYQHFIIFNDSTMHRRIKMHFYMIVIGKSRKN
jgi:hypothetical protein